MEKATTHSSLDQRGKPRFITITGGQGQTLGRWGLLCLSAIWCPQKKKKKKRHGAKTYFQGSAAASEPLPAILG